MDGQDVQDLASASQGHSKEDCLEKLSKVDVRAAAEVWFLVWSMLRLSCKA